RPAAGVPRALPIPPLASRAFRPAKQRRLRSILRRVRFPIHSAPAGSAIKPTAVAMATVESHSTRFAPIRAIPENRSGRKPTAPSPRLKPARDARLRASPRRSGWLRSKAGAHLGGGRTAPRSPRNGGEDESRRGVSGNLPPQPPLLFLSRQPRATRTASV